MNINRIILDDPNKAPGVKSVSLTLSVLMTIITTTLGIAQALGKIQSLGPFLEMFWSSWALYLGRRLNINGKSFSADKAEKLTKKVEEVNEK